MTTRVRSRARSRAWLFLDPKFALIVCVGLVASAPARAGDPPNGPIQPKPRPKGLKGLLSHQEPTVGTLGYGPPGPQPGFQGFGLRFGLNYGFGGGNALGVGDDGGYPFFGGPGYLHPAPTLRRIGGITAFRYFGGEGCPPQPQFFSEPAPLVYDKPVVTFEGDANADAGADDFGRYSGMIPYPEQAFASFSSEGGKADKEPKGDPASQYDTPTLPAPPPPADYLIPPPPAPSGADDSIRLPAPPPPPTGADDSIRLPTPPRAPSGAALNPIGIDAAPVVGYGSTQGLQVTRVHPGKAADRSGLVAGDVIRSANGYITANPGNLEWVLGNTTPGKPLNLTVRAARDGSVRPVTLIR